MRPHVSRRTLLSATVLGVVLAVAWVTPASADNCSVFTDCFGQANSAARTALGLGLLTALSIVLDFVPVVGGLKGMYETAVGRDLLTGEELADWERAVGVLGFIPGGAALGMVGTFGRAADTLGDVGRAGRGPDALGDASRGAGASRSGATRGGDALGGVAGGRRTDDVGGLAGTGRADHVGTTGPDVPIGPGAGERWSARGYRDNDALVGAYNAPGVTTSQRRALSERLGENGAVDYLERVSGVTDLRVQRPVDGDDLDGLLDAFVEGEPWGEAIAYRGSRATNVVWFDGETLHVIEAKGGSGRYGDRLSTMRPGTRISQTDPEYPLDVATDMRRSSKPDGRSTVGDIIQQAYVEDRVSYVGVRTGGREAILEGDVMTSVDDVFTTPTRE